MKTSTSRLKQTLSRWLKIAKKLSTAVTLLAGAALLGTTSCYAEVFNFGKLTIERPWARATAPAARTGVVYFNIKNAAAEADTLLTVSLDKTIAEQASLHEMTMNAKGLMHMAELKSGLSVSANGEVKFAPGGYHVMLEGLTKPLLARQTFELTLHFAKAGALTVPVVVE